MYCYTRERLVHYHSGLVSLSHIVPSRVSGAPLPIIVTYAGRSCQVCPDDHNPPREAHVFVRINTWSLLYLVHVRTSNDGMPCPNALYNNASIFACVFPMLDI